MIPVLPTLARSTAAVALVICSMGGPAFAQTTGVPIEVPGVDNFVAAAVGVVPDYLGSDDYTIGIAPAGVIKLGDTDRYVRLVVTDINVNLIDSQNWSFGPAINYRFGRSDVHDNAVDRMRDIDGTVEVGAFGGWSWIGSEDPRHRFAVGTEALFDVGGEHDGWPRIRVVMAHGR